MGNTGGFANALELALSSSRVWHGSSSRVECCFEELVQTLRRLLIETPSTESGVGHDPNQKPRVDQRLGYRRS